MATRKCGKGMRYRKTYTRKGTRVRGRCIRSQTRATESSRNKVKRILGRMSRRLRGIRKSQRSYKGTCKKGMILRKAYVRYTKRGKRTLIKEACIRNVGAPGKGLRGSRRNPGIGPLRKGDLSKFGYSNVSSLSVSDRHSALRKAVEAYGSLTTWRKLNAVYIYTRRTSPGVSSIFKKDMDWIKSMYGIKAF
jgi:hypothetical protein